MDPLSHQLSFALRTILDGPGPGGEFFLVDVRKGLFPLPPDRPIRELRVFQLLPKTATHAANVPRIGQIATRPGQLGAD